MPPVDLSVGAELYPAVEFPEGCTVGQWKQLLGQGHLGDKILYATKLVCREADKGRALEDAAALPTPPNKMYIDGPGSVAKMLELALRKKIGPPLVATQRLSQPAPVPIPPERKAASTYAAVAAASPFRGTLPPLKSNGADNRLRFFCAGQQGMRPHMEDRTCGVLRLPGHDEAALFGVFDGHGGHEVSELCSQLLPAILAEALSDYGDPAKALKESFRLLDEELIVISRSSSPMGQAAPNSFERVGSTAVVTLLMHEAGRQRLLCANCGDSRAVLCRQGHAMDLSVDQKPQNPEERARIEAAGGRVELSGPCYRIDAGLNLSRALGDFAYKANTYKSANEQKVISEPELQETIIDKEDEFVVMGSDGVFDVLTSEALVLHLRGARQRGVPWADAVDSALTRSLPGGDNVSLCLVEFLHAA